MIALVIQAFAADSGSVVDWSTRGALPPMAAAVRLTEVGVFDDTTLLGTTLEVGSPVYVADRGWGVGLTGELGGMIGLVAGPQPGFVIPRRAGATVWGWFDTGRATHAFGGHFASPFTPGGPWGLWWTETGTSVALRYAARIRWNAIDLAFDATTGLNSQVVFDAGLSTSVTWKVWDRFAAQGSLMVAFSRFGYFGVGARWRPTAPRADRPTLELGGDLLLAVPISELDDAPIHVVPTLSVQLTLPKRGAIIPEGEG